MINKLRRSPLIRRNSQNNALLLSAFFYLLPIFILFGEDNGLQVLTVLQHLEKLHGKMIAFAKMQKVELKYAGLLSRDSDKSGMVQERTGTWHFFSKERQMGVYLVLCEKSESPDCEFTVEGRAYKFRFEGDPKLETSGRIDAIGCSIREFKKLVDSLNGIEAYR